MRCRDSASGWIIGLPQLTSHLAKLVLCMLYGGPPFIQAGALAALTQDCRQVAEMAEAYQRRAGIMVSILKDVPGLRAGLPEGGMFVLLDARGTGLSSAAFADGLLDAHGVAAFPATASDPALPAIQDLAGGA